VKAYLKRSKNDANDAAAICGMFIGPIILLVIVPAIQTLFLDRAAGRAGPATGPSEPAGGP
jgi:hypothetical protein